MMETPELIRLLHEVDGQLGLAVHRGMGINEEWINDSFLLIRRIRKAIKEIEETHP